MLTTWDAELIIILSIVFPGLKDGKLNQSKVLFLFYQAMRNKLTLHFKSAWVNEHVAPWWDLEHENLLLPFVVSPAWPGSCPEALSVNVRWQPVNIGENSGDKDKKLLGVKGVGGNSISAGDSSRWKIFWGCWRMMAWTTAVKHTHFANRDFFSEHLFQAAWARLLCMLIGGGVIPFAAVIGQWWITIQSFGRLPPWPGEEEG